MKNPRTPVVALASLPDITPRRIRADGWTIPRQRRFLKSLALTGSVQKAAREAGMTPSSAYRLRLHPDAGAFRHGWSCALTACASALREIAFDRAINGTLEDVIYNGAAVARLVVHNDRLLMFLLREYGNEDATTVQDALARSLGRLKDADDPEAEMLEAGDPGVKSNNAEMSGDFV